MSYYLYQCAGCYTTIYGDALPKGESYTYIVNGELCSACQTIQNNSYDDEDEWYEALK